MKLGIETMIYLLLVVMGMFLVMSVYFVSLQASEAKQYHTWVMEQMEGARQAEQVQQVCKEEAVKRGYEIQFQKEIVAGRVMQKTTLKYQILLPFLVGERQYEINGYSTWKGGEAE